MSDLEAGFFDFGGPLHSYGADWNNGIININNGSTHEDNPYGGVPMGAAPDGEPNLVEEGEVVQGSFVFTNEGKYPLVIYDVNTSCGCTVADYPKGEIAPGEQGTISVKYDSEGSSGMRISKEVTVNANTTPAKTKLRIIADVR
jgi:hypothetical protein